jgi:hypothetical protein
MTTFFRRCTRWMTPTLLALGLFLTPAATPRARAQAPDPNAAPTGEEKGRSFDGYAATLLLVMLAFFLVGKSARR